MQSGEFVGLVDNRSYFIQTYASSQNSLEKELLLKKSLGFCLKRVEDGRSEP